jgi:hypothetical protein
MWMPQGVVPHKVSNLVCSSGRSKFIFQFLVLFFALAQRAFCAAAILARASALNRRFGLTGAAETPFLGRPGLRCTLPFELDKISFARCKRSISPSIAAITWSVFKGILFNSFSVFFDH